MAFFLAMEQKLTALYRQPLLSSLTQVVSSLMQAPYLHGHSLLLLMTLIFKDSIERKLGMNNFSSTFWVTIVHFVNRNLYEGDDNTFFLVLI